MNYIVFDLEFNQLYEKKLPENDFPPNAKKSASIQYKPAEFTPQDGRSKTQKNMVATKTAPMQANKHANKMPLEIIQIGALKLNEDLEVIDTFNRFVKPTLYTEIHPFIQHLTHITTSMVNHADDFPAVYKDFMKFTGHENFIMGVWGRDDIKQLIKNINFHKLDINNNVRKYIDIQFIASKQVNLPKGNKLGLKTAIELWNLPAENDFHNALHDALYTVDVFRKIYSKDLVPEVYSPVNPNLKVDTAKLLSQFETMFDRELTKEEKCIIRIAYNMGKTHRFLKR